MEKTKSRNVSVDLLKCLSMLFVIVFHCTGAYGVKNVVFSPPWDPLWLAGSALKALSVVAVNCFILITGYFQCEARFDYRKLVRLWIAVLTYAFGFYAVLCVLPVTNTRFSVREILLNLFPFSHRYYWFMTGYLLLLLLSPAFNRLIGAFTQREHKTVLIILFFVFSFLPSVFGDYLGTDGGYSLLWFTVLYFTAAYIRKYGLKKHRWFLLYSLCSMFTFLLGILDTVLEQKGSFLCGLFGDADGYNSVFVFFGAVCLFAGFVSKKISSDSRSAKAVIKVSSLSLGVYLLHDHEYLRPIIWNKLICLEKYQENGLLFFGVIIVSVFSLYIAGLAVEWVRSSLYRRTDPCIMRFADKIKDKIGEKI